MNECGKEAILIVTRSVDGTTTNVVKERFELTCGKPAGHSGDHADTRHSESWSSSAGERPTLVRHEDGTE